MGCTIKKKEFLGNKKLYRYNCPEDLEIIEDWAFANCSNLKEIELPNTEIKFGKDVFLNCGQLQAINVCGKSEQVGILLAASVREMNCYYLLDISAAGEKEWFELYDRKIREEIEKPDDEGFSKQILCGEEDYGSTDLKAYINSQVRRKCKLAMIRLKNDESISQKFKDYLTAYLKERTKGQPTEEAFETVVDEYGKNKPYFDIFINCGCVTEDNLEAMVNVLSDDYPEFKASLLNYKSQKIGFTDFFADLNL